MRGRATDKQRRGDPSLAVCPKCGWWDGFTHAAECSPDRGASADALILAVRAALPEVKPTKLGYGYGFVTFEISKDCHVSFDVETAGYRILGIRGLYWLARLDIETATQFVCMLAVLGEKLQAKRAKKED